MENPGRWLTRRSPPRGRRPEFGQEINERFLHEVAGIPPTWTMVNIIDDAVERVRERVGSDRVICALSGGVDSSVVAALLHRAVGDQLTCVFVDHGLLRLDEADEVVHVFRDQFHVDLVHVEAEERFVSLLDGVTDPEPKRRIIGEEFWKVFFEEAEELEGVRWLARARSTPMSSSRVQDSGGQDQEPPQPHPVPRWRALRSGRAAEPLFKDEVRAVGTELGLPDEIVHRQPFPGPGSPFASSATSRPRSSTCCAAPTRSSARRSSEWDTDRQVWQYFAVLPDIRSVGVMGDERTYAHPIIMRAVASGRRDDRRLGAAAPRAARDDVATASSTRSRVSTV